MQLKHLVKKELDFDQPSNCLDFSPLNMSCAVESSNMKLTLSHAKLCMNSPTQFPSE